MLQDIVKIWIAIFGKLYQWIAKFSKFSLHQKLVLYGIVCSTYDSYLYNYNIPNAETNIVTLKIHLIDFPYEHIW